MELDDYTKIRLEGSDLYYRRHDCHITVLSVCTNVLEVRHLIQGNLEIQLATLTEMGMDITGLFKYQGYVPEWDNHQGYSSMTSGAASQALNEHNITFTAPTDGYYTTSTNWVTNDTASVDSWASNTVEIPEGLSVGSSLDGISRDYVDEVTSQSNVFTVIAQHENFPVYQTGTTFSFALQHIPRGSLIELYIKHEIIPHIQYHVNLDFDIQYTECDGRIAVVLTPKRQSIPEVPEIEVFNWILDHNTFVDREDGVVVYYLAQGYQVFELELVNDFLNIGNRQVRLIERNSYIEKYFKDLRERNADDLSCPFFETQG